MFCTYIIAVFQISLVLSCVEDKSILLLNRVTLHTAQFIVINDKAKEHIVINDKAKEQHGF
jgi:hypothetical protein